MILEGTQRVFLSNYENFNDLIAKLLKFYNEIIWLPPD